MKSNVYFNVITTIIGLLLFHTATSETGYPLIGNPIEEPILLSVFGIGLLLFGWQNISRS
jgi:hypothetical protein